MAITMRKLLKYLSIFGCLAGVGQGANAQDPKAEAAPGNPYFAQFFTEKVFTVTSEGDGILPGSLRTALIQASGIRSNNNFTLVRITFDPSVKRVRVTRGPLPEIDGSLTTIDCQTPSGRGIIEGAILDTEGLDPAEEMAGLKITSTGNTVRNCHITGFVGPGILIRGTRNLIEFNSVGYHKDSPETAVPASAVYEEPKTNRGPGVLLGAGANANTLQNNEIVGNTYNGVELGTGIGGANKITYNYFAKNSGKPIKVAGTPARIPQITKIARQGDVYFIDGQAESKAEVQLYLVGKDEGEVGMNIVQGVIAGNQGFQIATQSKGFIPNVTKFLAISHSPDGNSSEFSTPQLIPGTVPTHAILSGTPEHELSSGKTDSATEAKSEKAREGTPAESESIEVDIPDSDKEKEGGEEPKQVPIPVVEAPPPTKPAESETTLNVKGMGDKGGPPDSGSHHKSQEVSSLGI